MPLFKNKPVTFNGAQVNVGHKVKEFKTVNISFEEAKYSDFKSFPLKVISVVPSLDTSVCNLQTMKVNTELSKDPRVVVLTISNDLPFAQKRWCGNSGLNNVITLSDYLHNDFSKQFGILMNEFKLLARAVYIVNSNDEIVYAEYVDNMSTHPNYEELIKHLNLEISKL
jgi:thioredoxin-dependent peroxiredoxin